VYIYGWLDSIYTDATCWCLLIVPLSPHSVWKLNNPDAAIAPCLVFCRRRHVVCDVIAASSRLLPVGLPEDRVTSSSSYYFRRPVDDIPRAVYLTDSRLAGRATSGSTSPRPPTMETRNRRRSFMALKFAAVAMRAARDEVSWRRSFVETMRFHLNGRALTVCQSVAPSRAHSTSFSPASETTFYHLPLSTDWRLQPTLLLRYCRV